MADRQIRFRDLWYTWYGVAFAWFFVAFVRIASYHVSMLLIVLAVALGVASLVFLIQGFAYIRRHGRQPTEDEQRTAFQQITKRTFAIAWAGLVVGCIAAMIVIIEVNDPFADEAIERVVKERSVLFWSVVAAGFVLGAGDRIWKMIANLFTKIYMLTSEQIKQLLREQVNRCVDKQVSTLPGWVNTFLEGLNTCFFSNSAR